MVERKAQTSVVILKNYFGLKPGQGLKDFAAEVKELSVEDKRELTELAAVELGVKIQEG